jgi:hypothetical protein
VHRLHSADDYDHRADNHHQQADDYDHKDLHDDDQGDDHHHPCDDYDHGSYYDHDEGDDYHILHQGDDDHHPGDDVDFDCEGPGVRVSDGGISDTFVYDDARIPDGAKKVAPFPRIRAISYNGRYLLL